jgi:hypothetical protein
MELEIIPLSKISQSVKDKYYMFAFRFESGVGGMKIESWKHGSNGRALA